MIGCSLPHSNQQQAGLFKFPMSDFSNLLSPDAYQQLNFNFQKFSEFSFNLKDLMEILFKLFSNSSNFHTILLFIE